MRRLGAAVSFLTAFPAPASDYREEDIARASLFFPLVGAGLGALAAALVWLGGTLPAGLTAALVLAAMAGMTRAFHLDGLADLADGLGGARERERALAIMRDPALGAFGAVAILLVLLTKLTALTALIEQGAAAGYLVAAPALARCGAVLLARLLPGARSEGLGSALCRHAGWRELGGSVVLAAAIVGLTLGRGALAAIGAALLASLAIGRLAYRRLGGVTGDVLGASIEIAEAAVLVVGAIACSR